MSSSAASSCVTMTIVVPRAARRASTRREHLLAGGVHAGGRLVHDEDVGLGGERAGDEHAPLLAAGERADVGAGLVLEADELEGLRDDGPVVAVLPPEPALVRQPADRHDLLHRGAHRGREGVPLRHVAEPGVLGEVGDGRAEHRHLPGQVVVQAEQAPDQGRLARRRSARAGPPPRRAARPGSRRRRPAGRRTRTRPSAATGRRVRSRPGRSRAPLAGAQRREVGAHDLEVVAAGGGVGQALDRVEGRHRRPGLPGHRVGDRRADQRLGVDGGDVVRLDEPGDLGELGRLRLGLGGEPGDADLGQPVALGEVAEGVVAGDDRGAGAVGQARAQVAVQCGEPVPGRPWRWRRSRPGGPGRGA